MTTDDHSALVALSLEYADAVRANDAARWAATWTDDARWVLGPGRVLVGRPAILEAWTAAMARYRLVVQQYHACAYEVDGQHARGRCELTELCVTSEGSRLVTHGHYRDTYRRTTDGWRFSSRELTRYYAGPPDLSALFVDEPPGR